MISKSQFALIDEKSLQIEWKRKIRIILGSFILNCIELSQIKLMNVYRKIENLNISL